MKVTTIYNREKEGFNEEGFTEILGESLEELKNISCSEEFDEIFKASYPSGVTRVGYHYEDDFYYKYYKPKLIKKEEIATLINERG